MNSNNMNTNSIYQEIDEIEILQIKQIETDLQSVRETLNNLNSNIATSNRELLINKKKEFYIEAAKLEAELALIDFNNSSVNDLENANSYEAILDAFYDYSDTIDGLVRNLRRNL